MPADRSAELFRAADSAGLTLRMLNPESDTLETIFLRLTGATDAELVRAASQAAARRRNLMRNAFRSELIRIWRPSFLLGGIGVMAGFAALISIFIFTSAQTTAAAQPPAPGQGPGSFTVAQIASPGGFFTALATVSRLAGVILLALWAIAVATDYSTGLIRILVQAQPNRVKLMAGKILALAVFTLLAATVTALVVVLLARPLARLEGIQVEAWKTDFLSHLVKGYFDFTARVAGLRAHRPHARRPHPQLGARHRHRHRRLLVVEGLITHHRLRRQLLPPRRNPEHPRRGRKPPTLLGRRTRTRLLYGVIATTVSLLAFRARDITS